MGQKRGTGQRRSSIGDLIPGQVGRAASPVVNGSFDAGLASGTSQNETDEIEDRNRSLMKSEDAWEKRSSSHLSVNITTFSPFLLI
jgi:hypothetical protein